MKVLRSSSLLANKVFSYLLMVVFCALNREVKQFSIEIIFPYRENKKRLFSKTCCMDMNAEGKNNLKQYEKSNKKVPTRTYQDKIKNETLRHKKCPDKKFHKKKRSGTR